MSCNNDIKCDICGHKFRTYSQVEQHYREYDLDDVICYYPLPEENAHLVKNYMCDDCYNKIGDIVRQLFIDEGEKHNKELEIRKQEAYKKYESEVAELESENKKVVEITNRVKATKEVFEFDDQLINDLKKNFPYTTNATYYLDSAIEIEKRTRKNVKKVWEWADEYNIDLESDRYFDFVDKETFKDVLPNSKIKNLSYKEVEGLINRL